MSKENESAAEPAAEPADDGTVSVDKAELDELKATASKVEALAGQVEKLVKDRSTRPKSTLTQLVDELNKATGVQEEAAEERKGARHVADDAGQLKAEIMADIALLAAADGAKAHNSEDVVAVLNQRGNPDGLSAADRVAALRKADPWRFKTTGADVDLQGGKKDPGLDPGIAELVGEINKAHGR